MKKQIKISIPNEIDVKDISSILYKPDSGFYKERELPVEKSDGFHSSYQEVLEFTGILVNMGAFAATLASIAMLLRNRKDQKKNKVSLRINIKTTKDKNVEIDLLKATDVEIKAKIKSLE